LRRCALEARIHFGDGKLAAIMANRGTACTKGRAMHRDESHPGIHNDLYGGMTDVGGSIRDPGTLGVLPENETCEGWSVTQILTLFDRVYKAWEPPVESDDILQDGGGPA
jgi:hypothetical protein